MTNKETINNKQMALISEIIKLTTQNRPFDSILNEIVNLLSVSLDQPYSVSIRIEIDHSIYISSGFEITENCAKFPMEFAENIDDSLEFFFKHDSTDMKDSGVNSIQGGYLKVLVNILTGFISKNQLKILHHDNNERLKELKSINLTNSILMKHGTLTESLQEICSLLPEAWQYPQDTVVRIIFDGNMFESSGYHETAWTIKQIFETPDGKKGIIEVSYLREFPPEDEGPFLKEERSLLNILASIISGTYSNRSLHDLLIHNTERLKELRCINQTSEILKKSLSFEVALQNICQILPEAWKYPESTVVRIRYEEKEFVSCNFEESGWVQMQTFETPGNIKGTIEIFLLDDFPMEDEGPFLKEERDLLINIAGMISGIAGTDVLKKILSENNERLKELGAINRTTRLISEYRPVDETLIEIAHILSQSWQYPRCTAAKICYEGRDYLTQGYKETIWSQSENFVTFDNKKGFITVVYLREFPESYEGPFLKEERDLLINIAKLISAYLNNSKGREIYRKNIHKKNEIEKQTEYKKSLVTNKGPLQLFFNQQVLDKYIYLEMMKYKVKEILFVATLYDAFILGKEDGFFERFMGEIYQYSLFSLPRITGVTTAEEALEMLGNKSFDLVILMVGLDLDAPVSLSEKIKDIVPSLPVYLLLNQKSKIRHFEELVASSKTLDNLFFWNGDSQIIFSIVKSIEDRINVANDTQVGLVRVILLVEDSSLYYSKYLQMLYGIVFGQVQQLLPEVEKNELDKISKMRSRPKILLARNYEDAMHLFNQYKDYLLCVISDIEFEHGGKPDKTAGIKFIKYVKSHMMKLPIILQSSDDENLKNAEDLDVFFMNKNSETLLNDLKKYLNYYLGFGDFIFRDRRGRQIAVAQTLREFEEQLLLVPDETFYLHALENQFSIWLMARGEIKLAKTINPLKIKSVEDVSSFRKNLLEIIKEYQDEKKKGRIFRFEEVSTIDEKNIVKLAEGSLGGKGRGLAFISTLINNLDFSTVTDAINIRTPKTAIIGTEEFDNFLHMNKLYEKIIGGNQSFDKIKQYFLAGEFSPALEDKLTDFLSQVHKPLAIRSSSLSEDSFTQPFAGVFHTYIIPNCREQKGMVLEKLKQAIKLVFASVFSDEAQGYYKAIHHRVEDEKMAVVLQELVGQRYGDYYYPHVSGTACSYNYYPVAHMKPEEGFAMAAFGLGTYVVDGMTSYRFSPKYPKVNMYSMKDIISSSQVKFYAVDCRKINMDYAVDGELASMTLLDISEAESHGALKHCVSVYDSQNDRIVPGLSAAGPRIMNFANILKYDYIPLAKTLELLLATLKDALGSPVEIEFAVDLCKAENGLPTFYLLQTKPMVESRSSFHFELDEIMRSKALLYTQTSLGNGEIDDLYDVIYIDPEKFDKMKTLDMVKEIEYLNNLMSREDRHYILIGPGRWGTRDQYLGIPVNWAQISNARIIVEISLKNFPLDSSLGSHFFHNVTSMNIGYFSVNDLSNSEFINWDSLYQKQVIHQTSFFRHIRFDKALKVLMDGKEKKSVIIENS
ncbi:MULTISPECIES: PEP/pyruvate-binding domain-containing protein [unclassified Oceanispirochaeta]|uniref:PEP/pyruvate-binding domain-containing protein n=1 Tax=unclassified Oceanispirochaeta TaxID=2635722 RepID=UPI000E09C787|nr:MULTISPECIES: PEP/pyruvate-binding domain-containing protein [unclassified Oceanispirochaeta]MBF9015828.1 hypothetical protein [Oceanispirochaeta sp. M2]NPD72291.1 hypothetical protein [Oceanispirochaeta sp. M1]RDG32384.1 hypothetical protein DV872_09280 [Oceanispirochaeta sp. M1]